MYKDRNYHNPSSNNLSQQQLADKAELEESIKDGSKNVTSTLKSIKQATGKETPNVTTGKRTAESSESGDYKRRGL